jgi:hypothetical protein
MTGSLYEELNTILGAEYIQNLLATWLIRSQPRNHVGNPPGSRHHPPRQKTD